MSFILSFTLSFILLLKSSLLDAKQLFIFFSYDLNFCSSISSFFSVVITLEFSLKFSFGVFSVVFLFLHEAFSLGLWMWRKQFDYFSLKVIFRTIRPEGTGERFQLIECLSKAFCGLQLFERFGYWNPTVYWYHRNFQSLLIYYNFGSDNLKIESWQLWWLRTMKNPQFFLFLYNISRMIKQFQATNTKNLLYGLLFSRSRLLLFLQVIWKTLITKKLRKKNELRPSSFCLMTGVFYLKGICIMKLRKIF